jgi:hypothetical protein
MILGNMDHRELDACVALDIDRFDWRDVGGAAELKPIPALADLQLGVASSIGASAK